MSEAANNDARTGERLRIVIADDHEPTRVLLRTLIELEGMEVVGEARDGSEAVALSLAHEPDAVLLDVNMPGLDGLDAAEFIRAWHPWIRLVLHSGEPLDGVSDRAAALHLPLADKLDLPIRIQQLAEQSSPPSARAQRGVAHHSDDERPAQLGSRGRWRAARLCLRVRDA